MQYTGTGLVKIVAIVVAQILMVAVVEAQNAKPDKTALPNFHQVNEHLYRGAQPHGEGIERLSEMGVKTILNLRDDDERADDEQVEAQKAGLRYFNVPFGWFGRPSEDEVARALAVINAPENWPVFVHCKRGSDRTGTVMAAYRIAHDGWTADDATREAKHFGLRWTQYKMKDFISDYYKQHRTRVINPGAAQPNNF